MVQNVNINQFRDSFTNHKDFSYYGLEVLFNYLETVPNYVLEVVELCCTYSESGITEALEDTCCETLKELEGKTLVLRMDWQTIVYRNF